MALTVSSDHLVIMSTSLIPAALGASLFVAVPLASAAVEVKIEHEAEAFAFEKVPSPAIDDAGASASVSVVAGSADRMSPSLDVVKDGKVPTDPDSPGENFFFGGTAGGRLVFDLGKSINISSVATYSAHPKERADQLYRLYGSTGTASNFSDKPAEGSDPKKAGWTLLATVDTRSATKGGGGRVGVELGGEKSRGVGDFRYLLFDVVPSVKDSPMSNTFFSEIDVIDADQKETLRLESQKPVVREFATKDGKYKFTVIATKAPDLVPWVEKELMPMVYEWYPKLADLLPSKGYKVADHVTLEFKDDMGGTPAYAVGNQLSLSVPFFRGQLEGEAKGCVVHEMVHTVQNYWRARMTNRNPSDTPGWVTEGIADYVRWFLYEPESKGAEITAGNISSARYDASYRVTANFFHYLSETYDPNIIPKLNAVCREGNYREELWKKWTGKPLEELGADWLAYHRKKLRLRD